MLFSLSCVVKLALSSSYCKVLISCHESWLCAIKLLQSKKLSWASSQYGAKGKRTLASLCAQSFEKASLLTAIWWSPQWFSDSSSSSSVGSLLQKTTLCSSGHWFPHWFPFFFPAEVERDGNSCMCRCVALAQPATAGRIFQ